MIVSPRNKKRNKPRRAGGLLCRAFFAAGVSLALALPAAAVSLSGNPYIKAPPYQPPPLHSAPAAPLGGYPPARKAESQAPYNPPLTQYRPRPLTRPGRAAQHDLWCRQNHPSYRPADNSYRPFDRSNTMPPQARRPCISPYSP